MNRRRGSAPPDLGHVDEVELPDGRTLTPGVEFSISGGGRFRFLYGYSSSPAITAHGPVGKASAKIRSFYPDRVKTVHRRRTV